MGPTIVLGYACLWSKKQAVGAPVRTKITHVFCIHTRLRLHASRRFRPREAWTNFSAKSTRCSFKAQIYILARSRRSSRRRFTMSPLAFVMRVILCIRTSPWSSRLCAQSSSQEPWVQMRNTDGLRFWEDFEPRDFPPRRREPGCFVAKSSSFFRKSPRLAAPTIPWFWAFRICPPVV